MNRDFSAKELKEAAALVEESLLAGLMQEDQPQHSFSPAFALKMEPVLRLGRKREQNHRAKWTVAAAFALVMICVFSWLASNAQARDAIQRWIRETWRNHIVFRFFGEETAGLPNYRPAWLPEGYEESAAVCRDNWISITYQNEDGGCIFFDMGYMQDGMAIDVIPNAGEEYLQEKVSILGSAGWLYLSRSGTEQSVLIWMDDETGMYFGISGILDRSVILHIAESVSLGKSPKMN